MFVVTDDEDVGVSSRRADALIEFENLRDLEDYLFLVKDGCRVELCVCDDALPGV